MYRMVPNQKMLRSSVLSLRHLKRSRLKYAAVQSCLLHQEHNPYNSQDYTSSLQCKNNEERKNYHDNNLLQTYKNYEEGNEFRYKKQIGSFGSLLGIVCTTALLGGGTVLSESQGDDSIDKDATNTSEHLLDDKNPREGNAQKSHLINFKYHNKRRNQIYSDSSTCLDKYEAQRLARKLLRQKMEEVGAPGITVAVTINGKTVWADGLGFADLENNVRCNPDTVMRVASISKSITMTAVAQLWEEGKLDLDAPIQKYIPSFPQKVYDGEQVTITTRQLLSHKSGIRHYALKQPDKKKEDTKKTDKTIEKDMKEQEDKEKSTSEEKDEDWEQIWHDSVTTNVAEKGEGKEGCGCNKSKENAKVNDESEETRKKNAEIQGTRTEKDNKISENKIKKKINSNEEKRREIQKVLRLNAKSIKRKKKKEEDVNEYDMEEYYIKEEFESVMDALKLFENDELFFKPGTGYLYTTHGYTLVSAVVEAAAGIPFTKVALKLFRELGLDSTYLDVHKPIIYNRARYYIRSKKGRLLNAPYVDNSYKWAGGGFLSTVGDLCKFGNAMLYARQYKGGSGLPGYLKASTVKELWTQVEGTNKSWLRDGGYGMGWAVCDGRPTKGCCRQPKHFALHSGGAIGASSYLLIMPEKEEEYKDENVENRKISKVEDIGKTGNELPKGVVVAILTNMQDVGLSKTAMEIGELFKKAYICTEE